MTNSISLLSKVEVGDEEIIHSSEPTFRHKNTLLYKGVLSNYRETKGTGTLTTAGNVFLPESLATSKNILFNVGATNFYVTEYREPLYTTTELTKNLSNKDLYFEKSIKVNGNIVPISYKGALEHTRYKPFIDGEILDTCLYNDIFFFIVKQSDVLYLCTDNTSELLIGTSAYFTRGVPYIVVTTATLSSIYNIGNLITPIESIEFPTNNGWATNDEFVLGYDVEDHQLCSGYFYDGNEWITYPYFGLVSDEGKLYGEPIPVNFDNTFMTPTRLSNGTLRWAIDNNASSNITVPEPLKLQSNFDESKYTVSAGAGIFYKILFSIDPMTNTWDTIENKTDLSLWSDMFINCSHRILIGANNNLGKFNGAKTEYDNIYPCKYMYTNIASRRGVDYDYGKGWYKAKLQTIVFGKAKSKDDKRYYTCLEAPAKFIWNYDGTRKSIPLDSTATALSFDAIATGNFGYSENDDDIPDETTFISKSGDLITYNYRHHSITEDVVANGQLFSFVHTVDFNVADIPFYRTYNGWTIHYYGDNVIGFSIEGTPIGTFSTEFSGNYYTYENNLVIGDTVYTKTDVTKISKVADYMFTMNTYGGKTIISEQNEKVEILNSSAPYINEMVPSMNIYNLPTKMSKDGGISNNTWLQAAGYNVNLDDKLVIGSGLLPAISANLYISAEYLDRVEEYTIRNGRPLFDIMTDNVDELDVYYTNTQSSTDCTYQYTYKKDKGISRDSNKTDTSWWLTNETIILPIGIEAEYDFVNYIASTVKLPDTYSCRLYTQNNTAFMLYNAAKQIYKSNQTFTIYASNYYYDGQAIYYSDNDNNELVCYAIGMRLLAASGTEAYFYSEYDKTIYTFTGSNTLTPTVPLSMLGTIVDSVFNSNNQTLYVLNDSNKLFVVDSKSTALFDTIGGKLYTSKDGCIIQNENQWQLLSPYKGDIIPIDVQTDWLGNLDKLFQFSWVDIVLYSEKPYNCSVDIFIDTLNNSETKSITKTIKLSKSDWSGTMYRIRLNPENIIGNAFRVGIKSDDDIHIASIAIETSETKGTNNVKKGW